MSIVVQAVEEELRGNGSIIDYRSMHQRLTREHHLECRHGLDTDHVRRNYSTNGPNCLWHVDKLKPFGFCLHGAIDGCSRKILLLEVCNSYNDPRIIIIIIIIIIAKYYLDYVRQVRWNLTNYTWRSRNLAPIQQQCSD